MIAQSYCLEMMEELRQAVGFKCRTWALLERGVVIKAPKSLRHLVYLLQCDAVLRMPIPFSFLIIPFASGHIPVRKVWFMDFPQCLRPRRACQNQLADPRTSVLIVLLQFPLL